MLKDESASSAAANRFALQADYVLRPDGAVTLQYDSTSSRWAVRSMGQVGAFAAQLLHVRDEKLNGTDGGSFVSGAWRTRTLNVVTTNEIAGASLSSSLITLPSGTYYVFARAPAAAVGQAKARFENTTDNVTAIVGSNTTPSGSGNAFADSICQGRFTITAQKNFALQHRCSATMNTTGFGSATSFGLTEIYSEVLIWKLA